MKPPDVSDDVRSRLAIALDVDDLVEAGRLGRRMLPWFSVAKIGLELFSAAGPEAVGAFVDQGYKVFLDMKLHDIPTTVGRASRVLGSLGVSYVTVHSSGGVDMLSAAVDGLHEGASAAGLCPPAVLAVTVLTSEPNAPRTVLEERLTFASEANCGGVVCAASDLGQVSRLAPELLTVVPGIRPEGVASHDQGRPATPSTAIQNGAGILVIGRAVTAADEPEVAASAIAMEVANAI
ncbi:MAG: orotidine-5'-phosphate decarboxylase [Actinomycetota bacterium]|nr:orotidine-5'-phosphate decarboxylase [Acidimicrobiaceae bacterium]MEC7916445.1 orotidine-5'-phosphate decarboxylase [Actinomycetota bacterium]MEC9058246.1 orotidine-5'-phosphate decarboxylase [Actinomycetota bacterium]MEC9473393.1 orotidine-5'-phosphate decarboxylase [Actinomycetota bacterium]MEE3256314.1 orotidine-5'-phosphate decarboxylase [Actinomycetota bacterium]